MSKTHAERLIEKFEEGTAGPDDLYEQADSIEYLENGNDVLLYSDGSKLTVPEDGEAVSS